MYSAGLVLLELLAGKTPFDGDSPLEIMGKMVTGRPMPVQEFLPDASDALAALLEYMLNAIPPKRPADTGLALARLRETEEFSEVSANDAQTIRITPPVLQGAQQSVPFRRLGGRAVLVIVLLLGNGLLWPIQEAPKGISPPEEVHAEGTADSLEETDPIHPRRVVSPNVDQIAVVGDYAVFAARLGSWRTLWSCGVPVPLWPEISLGPEDTIFKDGAWPVDGALWVSYGCNGTESVCSEPTERPRPPRSWLSPAAWDAIRRDIAGLTGRNVVLHEFAHQLDQSDGASDGWPTPMAPEVEAMWLEIMAPAFKTHVASAEKGKHTTIPAYGAKKPAEFYAVFTELFFEQPQSLFNDHRKIYEVLSAYYCQDPRSRVHATGARHWRYIPTAAIQTLWCECPIPTIVHVYFLTKHRYT